MHFFERLVNSLTDEADRQAILTMANRIFDLFASIFASIPMEEPHVIA